jgi:hypothetical protein
VLLTGKPGISRRIEPLPVHLLKEPSSMFTVFPVCRGKNGAGHECPGGSGTSTCREGAKFLHFPGYLPERVAKVQVFIIFYQSTDK